MSKTAAETEGLYEVALLDFSGFYESWHDAALSDCAEGMADVSGEEGVDLDRAEALASRFHSAFSLSAAMKLDYSKAYVDLLKDYLRDEKELNLPSMAFSRVTSPREYNFSTDRIFVTIDQDDLNTLVAHHEQNPEAMRDAVRERFTPVSGFVPHYSPHIEAWGDDPTRWDANELGVLLEAACGGWDDYEVLASNDRFSEAVYGVVDKHLSPEAVSILNALQALVRENDSPEPESAGPGF